LIVLLAFSSLSLLCPSALCTDCCNVCIKTSCLYSYSLLSLTIILQHERSILIMSKYDSALIVGSPQHIRTHTHKHASYSYHKPLLDYCLTY
jgi:hypothetical protein